MKCIINVEKLQQLINQLQQLKEEALKSNYPVTTEIILRKLKNNRSVEQILLLEVLKL